MIKLLRRVTTLALIAGAVLAGAILVGSGAPSAARAVEPTALARSGVDDFAFASFEADYELGRDGDGRSTLHAVEHLVAEFPEFDQNRGIIRDIPREYNGFDTRLDIRSVTDEHGTPREFTTEQNGEYLSVIVAVPEGSFVHGEQHYVIEYTQHDVTRAFADTGADEFYWDVNGTDWRQPFGRVSATLTLGPGLADALTGSAACYRGAYGSTDRCEIAVDGDTVTAEEAGLSAYENVTIAVGFEPGTFAAAQKPFIERVPLLVYGGIGVFAAGIATVIGTLIRNRVGARTGRAIIAQYEPPAGISVAVAAELLRSRRGMTATLLDLAVRRRIRLLHDEPTDQYGAQLLDRTGLSQDESRALKKLFGTSSGPGATYWFDRRSTRLGDAAADLRRAGWNETARRGLMRKTGGRTMFAVALCFVVGLALPVLHSIIIGDTVLMTVLLAVGINALVWFTIGVLALLRKSRTITPAGAPIREHLLGLREYIRLAEADRIRMLQSASGAEVGSDWIVQVYEQLLPYAVLFGLEREWQAELEPYYRESPPDWTSGSGASSFSSGLSLSSFGSAVSSSPTTHVSSSSGSGSGSSFSSSGGSSGGGSSGGGGGGGGGGGI